MSHPEFLELPPLLSAQGKVRLPGSKSISNRVLLLEQGRLVASLTPAELLTRLLPQMELTLWVPQRFHVTQQRAWGDRHLYALRSRFVPDALLARWRLSR